MRRAQEAEQERIAQLAREKAELDAKARQLAEEEARRKQAAAAKDLQVRNMLIGSWTYTDTPGHGDHDSVQGRHVHQHP